MSRRCTACCVEQRWAGGSGASVAVGIWQRRRDGAVSSWLGPVTSLIPGDADKPASERESWRSESGVLGTSQEKGLTAARGAEHIHRWRYRSGMRPAVVCAVRVRHHLTQVISPRPLPRPVAASPSTAIPRRSGTPPPRQLARPPRLGREPPPRQRAELHRSARCIPPATDLPRDASSGRVCPDFLLGNRSCC
jgi:hypothetical protein